MGSCAAQLAAHTFLPLRPAEKETNKAGAPCFNLELISNQRPAVSAPLQALWGQACAVHPLLYIAECGLSTKPQPPASLILPSGSCSKVSDSFQPGVEAKPGATAWRRGVLSWQPRTSGCFSGCFSMDRLFRIQGVFFSPSIFPLGLLAMIMMFSLPILGKQCRMEALPLRRLPIRSA